MTLAPQTGLAIMKRKGRVSDAQEGPNGDRDRSDTSSEVGSEIHVADSLPTNHDNDGKITAAGGLLKVNGHDGSRASAQEVSLHALSSPWKKQAPLPTATKESLAAMLSRLRSDSMLQSDDILFCFNHQLEIARNAMRSTRNSLGEFKLFDPGFPFHESDQGRLDHPKALPRHLLFIFNYEDHWTLGHLDCKDRVMRHYDSYLSYGVDRWESIQQRMREWTNAHSLVPKDTLQLIQPEGCPQQNNDFDCGIFAIAFAVGLITVGTIPDDIQPSKLRIDFAEQAQISLKRDEDNLETNITRSHMSRSFNLQNISQASIPSTHRINFRSEGNSSSNRTPLPKQRNNNPTKRPRIASPEGSGSHGNTQSAGTASRKGLMSLRGCMNNGLTPSPELQPTRIATQQDPRNPKRRQGKRNRQQVETHNQQREAGSEPQQLAVDGTPDNEQGHSVTSQSLSLSIVMGTPEFGEAWRGGDDCSLKLSDDDISCLPSSSPLTSKIVDVALYLVGALDPINTVVVGSTTDKIIISPSAEQTFLIPIAIPSSGCPDHWVLAVHSHSGIRLFDSLPSDTHTQFSRERIETLYAKPPGYSSGQVENFPHIIESRDSGVAVLVNAIHIVAVSLGSRMEEPIVLNIKLWRDVLTMILKLTTGETYHLPWADAFNHDAIVWDGDETVDGERQLLWHPKSSLVDYQLACEAIASQQRYLDAQLKTIQAAFAKKQSQTVSLGRDAGSISSTLHSLLNGAISHKELVEAEGQRCTDALGTIAQLEAQWNESWTLRGGCQISNESGRLRKRVLEVQERLSCRTRTLSSLDKCLKAMDELVSGLTNTTG